MQLKGWQGSSPMLPVEPMAAKTTHSTQGTLARYQSAVCRFDKRLSEKFPGTFLRG
jgi:hypothetical protein